MAGYHTETDSYYKRHRKGFLFTLGDEPCLKIVPGHALEQFLGYQKPATEITAQEALAKAREQYEVFHIHVTNASYKTSEVEKGWKSLVGDHFLTANSGEIANIIAETIKKYYIPEDVSNDNIEEETVEEKKSTEESKSENNLML